MIISGTHGKHLAVAKEDCVVVTTGRASVIVDHRGTIQKTVGPPELAILVPACDHMGFSVQG